jgi:GR25 family glycosyltransferase involved in LPS biosynthesis
MTIFEYPLYYISFKKNDKLEKACYDLGFKNVNHFSAVDGRKFTPYDLLKNNIITTRSYQDLVQGRDQAKGISSLGAIGCTMSHDALWNLCVKNKFPYIIILEDDVKLPKSISKKNIDKINDILSKKNSIFISANIIKKDKYTKFLGTHFYIISNSSCKELIKNTYPIDVQTDWYMSHMDNIKKVNIEGFQIAKTNIHKSSIQDTCIKCMLPKNIIFYLIFICFVFVLIIMLILLYVKYKNKCVHE